MDIIHLFCRCYILCIINAWIKSWVTCYIYCLFNIFRVGRAAERARRHPRETNTRNVTIWSGNCWEITSNSVQENILLYYNRKYFISTRIMLSFLSDTPYDSTPYLLPGNKPGNLLKCSRNYSYLKIFCTSFFPIAIFTLYCIRHNF